MARLLSVNVGLPRDILWQGKTVSTAIWKTAVTGPRMARRLNIDGDGQADLAGHGGERRAVFVYQMDSYLYWQKQLHREDFVYGQFGENFTIDGLPDAEVCIGDRYRIGKALFEVTQPRVTCYRLGVRMNEPEMAALVVRHGRPGFYFRVIEEGEVQAGDEVVKIASGAEAMTVFEINALLYWPGHPRDKLERALRIPALSSGWHTSFEALLKQANEGGAATGNAGLAGSSGPPLAWRGFRPLRVMSKVRESETVVSLLLGPEDGQPVPAPSAGQFMVLRLGSTSAPALMRSYSLSGAPGEGVYRVSVKREPHGAASSYIDEALKIGDIVEAGAPRGTFTLRPGSAPVVLLSAGIGVTPVLAMLHALVVEASKREVWWLYGTRNGREHPFAKEVRDLLDKLAHAHSHIRYSAPDPDDRPGVEFDASGHLDLQAVKWLDLPSNADFYICGPPHFMTDLTEGLVASAISSDHIHTETFGSGSSITPGIASAPRRAPHLPDGPSRSGALISFARTGLNVRWEPAFGNLLELAEACDVPARWSCRTGVCHTCETGLVAGGVVYDPDPVDAPADGNVLICCSQPKGDIVLDL
ncbi:MOSC and FAD-binding oxidoreductase domain-containing protein [Rhizobium tubonense]|uniref:nitric oxide dioxygenase n=1 Tax=Rhizobium tubonense TaxID=484088 RepID=A0A2W4CT86_9HYPH|nr:MOSC and FAD-binding oxidoreductase domain-containing protein [Rhizobium tubonense]PZM08604.1 sulfurase [Rhizobium tubonense]